MSVVRLYLPAIKPCVGSLEGRWSVKSNCRRSGHRTLFRIPVFLELREPLRGRVGFIAVVLELGIAGVYAWLGSKIVGDQFHGDAQFFCDAQIFAVQNSIGCCLHAVGR